MGVALFNTIYKVYVAAGMSSKPWIQHADTIEPAGHAALHAH